MPAAIAAVAAPAAPAAPGNAAPVQTSAGTGSKAPPAETKAPIAETKKPGGETKPEGQETAAEKAWRLRRKVKIGGKEEELDLGEDEVVREIQKARHYDRTRKDFDTQRTEFENTLKQLTEDPLAFLSKRGVDLKQLALEQQTRDAELAKLSPAERRAAELEAEIARRDTADKKRTQAEQQAAQQREHMELVQNTVRTIDSAIKLSGRARSGELVKLYSEVMELAEHAGEPPMSPEQIVSAGERLEVKRLTAGLKRAATDPAWRSRNAGMMKELAQAILPALDGQELVDFVGRENAVKLAKAQLQLYRKNPIPTVAESTGQTQSPREQPKVAESPQSMHALLDQLAGGR